MQLLQSGKWNKNISVSDLLERKGCDEFALLEEQMYIRGYRYEIWWYAYQGAITLSPNNATTPYTLYFFRLDSGDLFRVQDFRRYMETGELLQPIMRRK